MKVRFLKFFSISYNFIYCTENKDYILNINNVNEDFYKTIIYLNKIRDENKNNGFFTGIYNNIFKLIPSIWDFEHNITSLESNSAPLVLENLLGLPNMNLASFLGLNIHYTNIQQSWQNAKIEIATIYLQNILDFFADRMLNKIYYGNIFKIITKSNYGHKKLILNEEIKNILKKIKFVINLKNRQKLVYIVGKPGTGKTTIIIDYLIRNGYIIYYINGNNVLFSDHPKHTIIYILNKLKNEILLLPPKKRSKTIIIFDECEVAMKEIKYLNNILNELENKTDILSQINKNQTEKEKALTICMLDLLSVSNLPVICISNGVKKISPYMERRITYLINFSMEKPKDYIFLWEELLYKHNITFNEGEIDDLIFEIGLFSCKKNISIRTIKQFVNLFEGKRISIITLFEYCTRFEE